jgi:chromosome segregation ATPase
MPERIERLRVTLAELEQELAELDSLDQGSRERLEEVAGEIAEVLRRCEVIEAERAALIEEANSPANAPPDEVDRLRLEPPHSLRERLLDQIEFYRVQHPTVAGILQRLIHGLAGLGI